MNTMTWGRGLQGRMGRGMHGASCGEKHTILCKSFSVTSAVVVNLDEAVYDVKKRVYTPR